MRKLLLIKQETVFAPFCGLIGMRGHLFDRTVVREKCLTKAQHCKGAFIKQEAFIVERLSITSFTSVRVVKLYWWQGIITNYSQIFHGHIKKSWEHQVHLKGASVCHKAIKSSTLIAIEHILLYLFVPGNFPQFTLSSKSQSSASIRRNQSPV